MNTNEKIKQVLMIAGALFLAAAGAAAIWYARSYSQTVGPLTYRSFSVSAEGKVVAIPDIAQVTFSVISQNGDLAKIQADNTDRVNDAIAFVKSKGIAEEDIKTQNYSIEPRYEYYPCRFGPCPSPAAISGYSVTQTVAVKIRDFAVIGEVLAGVVERGANSVSGPYFTVDDPAELQNRARREAITKAKDRAKAVAEAGGFVLGPLLSIEDSFYPIPYGYDMGRGGAGGGIAEFAVPAPTIEPGSQEITVTVVLRYGIK